MPSRAYLHMAACSTSDEMVDELWETGSECGMRCLLVKKIAGDEEWECKTSKFEKTIMKFCREIRMSVL